MTTELIRRLADDLSDETEVLVDLVRPLTIEQWLTPTIWSDRSVADQVAHLARADEVALTGVTDPARFRAEAARRLPRGAEVAEVAEVADLADRAVREARNLSPGEVLARFRRARAAYLVGVTSIDPRARVAWYGADSSVASSITLRLAATWKRTLDVADVLGADVPATGRLRHVADLVARSLTRAAGSEPVRFELSGPDGELWVWGPETAPDRIGGTALDLCLLAVRRRQREELDLEVVGPVASAQVLLLGRTGVGLLR